MVRLNIGGGASPSGLTVLCLGCHSDDIEIGCGGTILRLVEQFPNAVFHWVVFCAAGKRGEEAHLSAGRFVPGIFCAVRSCGTGNFMRVSWVVSGGACGVGPWVLLPDEQQSACQRGRCRTRGEATPGAGTRRRLHAARRRSIICVDRPGCGRRCDQMIKCCARRGSSPGVRCAAVDAVQGRRRAAGLQPIPRPVEDAP